MGIRKNSAGAVVQFYDNRGRPDGPAVHGEFVELFGLRQVDIHHGQPTAPEGDEPGSADWMTLVAVADSQEKLDRIVESFNGVRSGSNTSAASHRVRVEVDVEDALKRNEIGRITIANGRIDRDAGTMDVMLVKVMGEGTVMNEDHPLIEEFRRMGPFLG